MQILKGVDAAKKINEEILATMQEHKDLKVTLGIVRVGERGDDIAYERGVIKKCEKLGFSYELFKFDADISNDDFIKEFDKINENPEIDGILMFKPLPKQIDEKEIEGRIDKNKDLDGISPINMALVYAGDDSGFAPCTAEAVVELLDFAGIDITGKRVCVIGRSTVIGKPVSLLLLKKNATVTICHTKTVNMEEECKRAEILVAAAGVPKMVKASFVSEGAVVIDVGINVDKNGNLCGDVDFDEVSKKASVITPVPGGVGSVTTSVLAKHLLRAALKKLD